MDEVDPELVVPFFVEGPIVEEDLGAVGQDAMAANVGFVQELVFPEAGLVVDIMIEGPLRVVPIDHVEDAKGVLFEDALGHLPVDDQLLAARWVVLSRVGGIDMGACKVVGIDFLLHDGNVVALATGEQAEEGDKKEPFIHSLAIIGK